jgi:NADPH:quinone reductase-like Zn-dependent oxidoreductase
MKAIGYKNNLPIEDIKSLEDIVLDAPKATGKDILVEIKAISVNPVDYKVRATVPADDDAWKVIGWDASGIVKEVGADVTLLRLAMKSGMQAISLVKGLMHNTKL